MAKSVRQLAAVALALVVVGCSNGASVPDGGHGSSSPSRAERSQAVLELYAGANEPGCSAAVGERGNMLWRGVRGLADLESAKTIDTETVFDIASVSKQFTAAAILLLEDAGKLRLQDPLSTYLPDLPTWSHTTTLAQLMHHTSGIPDYPPLLQRQGHKFTDRATHSQTLKALGSVKQLEFAPGSSWAYSNSNYVLLAEVVRVVSGEPLPRYLQSRLFEPLDLDMVLDPVGAVPNKAVSYKGQAPNFAVVDYRWEQVGDGGIQTTPGELVRWADNYRTGRVGGLHWQRAVLADAVEADPSGRTAKYGAGIHSNDDGSLRHPGTWEGFGTDFWISPDRNTAIAVACNKSLDPHAVTDSLRLIWITS